MDPNANIARQRELAAEIAELRDQGSDALRAELMPSLAMELAELVQALDEWRVNGGFDPYLALQSPDKRVRDALSSILAYNWASEEADYVEAVRVGDIEAAPGSGHVYEALTIVRAYLDGSKED